MRRSIDDERNEMISLLCLPIIGGDSMLSEKAKNESFLWKRRRWTDLYHLHCRIRLINSPKFRVILEHLEQAQRFVSGVHCCQPSRSRRSNDVEPRAMRERENLHVENVRVHFLLDRDNICDHLEWSLLNEDVHLHSIEHLLDYIHLSERNEPISVSVKANRSASFSYLMFEYAHQMFVNDHVTRSQHSSTLRCDSFDHQHWPRSATATLLSPLKFHRCFFSLQRFWWIVLADSVWHPNKSVSIECVTFLWLILLLRCLNERLASDHLSSPRRERTLLGLLHWIGIIIARLHLWWTSFSHRSTWKTHVWRTCDHSHRPNTPIKNSIFSCWSATI